MAADDCIPACLVMALLAGIHASKQNKVGGCWGSLLESTDYTIFYAILEDSTILMLTIMHIVVNPIVYYNIQ